MIYWIHWGERAHPVHFWSSKCWHLSNTEAFTQSACRSSKLINATCLKHSLAEFNSRQPLSHFSPKQWCQIYITHLKDLVGASWNHSLVAQMVKRLPTMRETQVQSLGWEDPLEKEMANHSRILAWKISLMESLVGYSSRGCKKSDTTEQLHLLKPCVSCL